MSDEPQPVVLPTRLPAAEIPLWLARLHRQLPPEATTTIIVRSKQRAALPVGMEALLAGGGFALLDVVGQTDHRVERLHSLPDWVGPKMQALVVGLNPSPASADHGVNFARPGNRFWPAALAAGLVEVDRDPEHALTSNGVGFSDLVKRTTRTASELTTVEFRNGVDRLAAVVAWLRPGMLIVVGLAGWRAAVNRKAVAGWQDETMGTVPVYLMPNTSGLNANSSLDDFTNHFRAAKRGPTPKR